jgi:hypothetical protein
VWWLRFSPFHLCETSGQPDVSLNANTNGKGWEQGLGHEWGGVKPSQQWFIFLFHQFCIFSLSITPEYLSQLGCCCSSRFPEMYIVKILICLLTLTNCSSYRSHHVCSFLTLSNPIFLPPAYSPALVYFGRERGWWITCNYPTVLKEENINRKSTTCAICWLKSVLHEEKHREQESHNVGQGPT